MNLLLDTCTFLWITTDSSSLSSVAKREYRNPNNTLIMSVVSVWELIVKNAIGKLPLSRPPREFITEARYRLGIESLPLTENALFQLANLPDRHKDPFDRLLVCQAIEEGLTILTPDKHIQAYPVRTLW